MFSCARPIAEFAIPASSNTAPVELTFDNRSEQAEDYIWRLDEKVVSRESIYSHQFINSGRYIISLEAIKGGKSTTKKQEVIINAPEKCHVLMETSLGNMTFELSEKTQGHLKNFTALIESGYYNGLAFHRVIDGFMVQGGNDNTRKEKKKYDYPATIPHEIDPTLHHYQGALAAARMPDSVNPEKASSGTQFYIVEGTAQKTKGLNKMAASKLFTYTQEQLDKYIEIGGAPQLDGEYTVFGYLVSGIHVLEKISSVETDKTDKPNEDVRIIDIKFIQ